MIERAGFTGVEIGWLHTVREIPGLLAVVVIAILLAVREQVLALLMRYSEFEIAGDKGLYYSNRIKQWFSYLKLQYPQAEALFARLRLLRRSPEILALLQSELALSEPLATGRLV